MRKISNPLPMMMLLSILFYACNKDEPEVIKEVKDLPINKYFKIGKVYELDTITIINTETDERASSFFSDPHVSASLTLLDTIRLLYTYQMKEGTPHPTQDVEKVVNYKLDNLTLWTEEPLFVETNAYQEMIGDFYEGQELDYHVANLYPTDTSLYRLDVNYSIKLTFKRDN